MPTLNQTGISDEVIERALAATDIIPEFVEWDGNPERRVVVRIEPHMGHFSEVSLYPWMDRDRLVAALEACSWLLGVEAQ